MICFFPENLAPNVSHMNPYICLKKELDHPFHCSVYVQTGSLPIDEDRVCQVGVWVILCDGMCFEFCITSTM